LWAKLLYTDTQSGGQRTTQSRCFTADSIAGGILRQSIGESIARTIAHSLERFTTCSHTGSNEATSGVCGDCAALLSNTSRDAEEDTAAAARFSCSLSALAFRKRFHLLKKLAQCAAEVLRYAADTKERYLQKYYSVESSDAVQYTADYKAGATPVSEEDWLRDAQRTGKLFPCHPEVRPRMDFGASSRRENMHNCMKNYVKVNSHSSGIFTVLCTCRNPILLVFSVMLQNKGISTALSFLLSRFRKLPRVCYYDNACNMMRRVTLKVPWVADQCLIVCDRYNTGSIHATAFKILIHIPRAIPMPLAEQNQLTAFLHSLVRLSVFCEGLILFLSLQRAQYF